MTKREINAYLAGAIDSDGTIGIKKSTYAMRVTGDSAQPAYSERVALRQVTDDIVRLLHAEFGGSVYQMKPSALRGRPLFSWTVTDRKAADCLRRLMPWLRVKREQARNALRLRAVKERSKAWRVRPRRGHAGSAARSPQFSGAMEMHYQIAKRLNRVGA